MNWRFNADNIFWQGETITVFIHEINAVGTKPPLPVYFDIAEDDGGESCERVPVSKEDLLEFCQHFLSQHSTEIEVSCGIDWLSFTCPFCGMDNETALQIEYNAQCWNCGAIFDVTFIVKPVKEDE